MHHCVEGATVGPGDFTFTSAPDVIRHRDVPPGFAAALSGHIHRHQVLTADLRGRPLRTPVLYPGSLERTSHAEIGEPKGYLLVRLAVGGESTRVHWAFHRVPARPMMRRLVAAEGSSPDQLEAAIRAIVAASPADAVLTIRVTGEPTRAHLRRLSARHLRTFVPDAMNLDVRWADAFAANARGTAHARRGPGAARAEGAEDAQLEVAFD